MSRCRFSIILVLSAGVLISAADATAQEPAGTTSWIKPTEKLQGATVTVRILCDQKIPAPAEVESQNPIAPAATSEQTKENSSRSCTVVVCSGICVGKRKFITAVQAGTDSQIRLTFPGGTQGDARLKVIDEFSGLALLESKTDGATPIEFNAQPVAAGSWVMTGSAWGVEKPIVSLGVVGAVDRTLTGVAYPPLLQCDLRTTSTSSGGGVVNHDGKLLGIVVATDKAESQRGWAYVVPASHVERILRAAADGSKSEKKGDDTSVIVLKRRRPIVGIIADSDAEGRILVRRVTPGGPAEKAGIKVGDQIIATDGVLIRSVYQAVLPTLHKQPGDTVTFRIQRGEKSEEIQVTLGGGVELPSLPVERLADVIQPKLELRREGQGSYSRLESGEKSAEVFSPGKEGLEKAEPTARPAPTTAEKIAVLEKAMDRYQKVIELQQQQLKQRDVERARMEEILKSLQGEIDSLRKQVEKRK